MYLSLYTTIGSMVDEITGATCSLGDSLSLWSLKVKSLFFLQNTHVQLCLSRKQVLMTSLEFEGT